METKIISTDETELIQKLIEIIENVSNDCIEKRDVFYVGVSGGSLVRFLSRGLQSITTDFRKWKIFFCDERVVPIDDPESTYGVYKKELGNILKEEQYIPIKQGVSANEAAFHYNQKLKEFFGDALPKFDMLLLGVGPDGHTCSLFPNHSLLLETERWVAPITDSPKPPSERVTFTFPVINNARYCVFALAGESKADIVKRILVDTEDLPASKVQPIDGELYWILDKDAAKYLKN